MPVSRGDSEPYDADFFFAFALLPDLSYELVGACNGFSPAASAVEDSESCWVKVEFGLSWVGFVFDYCCFAHSFGSSHFMWISSGSASIWVLAPDITAMSMFIWRIRFKAAMRAVSVFACMYVTTAFR